MSEPMFRITSWEDFRNLCKNLSVRCGREFCLVKDFDTRKGNDCENPERCPFLIRVKEVRKK